MEVIFMRKSKAYLLLLISVFVLFFTYSCGKKKSTTNNKEKEPMTFDEFISFDNSGMFY